MVSTGLALGATVLTLAAATLLGIWYSGWGPSRTW
jgi:hypothetical protein